MRNGMPTSMMQLYGQDKLDPYGLNQGQDSADASGGMMQSQNSQAMRNNLMGPYTNPTGMMGMMGFARGGGVDHQAIQDALHIARQHFRGGGGIYNFHPQFQTDRDALTRLIDAEAANQDEAGKLAVAYNARNRADAGYVVHNKQSDLYWKTHDPHSITDQILAPKQYSSMNPNSPKVNAPGVRAANLDPNSSTYQTNAALSDRVLGRMEPDPTMGSSHYYALNGMKHHQPPNWAHDKGMQFLGNNGAHSYFQSAGFNPNRPDPATAMGDNQMMNSFGGTGMQPGPGMPGSNTLPYNLPGNMRLPQLQQTSMAQPSPSISQPSPAPAQMDNAPLPPQVGAPLPPMRPQSGPLQSEAGWKPPAEIADKPHSLLGDTHDIKAPMDNNPIGGDVQFAPSNMSPASDISMSGGPFSDFGGGIGGSMGDFGGDFGGGLGDIFSSLFSRGGRTKFADGGSEDLNNGAFGASVEFAPAPERRTIEEHYPKPDNGSDLYAIAHDPREEPMKRYGAMGAGIVSDIAHGAWDQIKKPGEALRGEWSPTDANGRITDEAIGWGANTGLGALGGGTVFHEAPAGSLGMFIGKNAKGIDRAMYDTAQRDLMGYEGGPKPYGDLFSGGAHVPPKTSDQVFEQYGLHPYGTEEGGAPRMWGEISDANAKADYSKLLEASMAKRQEDARQHFMDNKGYTEDGFYMHIWPELQRQFKAQDGHIQHLAKLPDFYDHPELYEKYPHLRDLPVLVDQSQGSRLLGRGVQGSYGTKINGTPGIVVRRKLARDDQDGFNSTLAHEIQHAIQDHEGIKSLGSDAMSTQVHTTPAWETWNKAMQNDPALQEYNALRDHPNMKAGEEALAEILSQRLSLNGSKPKDVVEEALKRLDNQYPEFVRRMRLDRDLFSRGIPAEEPVKTITGHEAYLSQGIEGQARNTQHRLDWDESKRRGKSPLGTIPAKSVRRANEVVDFIRPEDILHKKSGGRVGYATGSDVEGDVSYMDETDKRPSGNSLPMMAESPDAVQRALSVADSHQSSSPHEFVQSKLFDPNDQKQLPQYDPEAGANTAKQAALTAYGMTDVGGIQQALGYMPKAEGGYEPSVAEDYKSGNYLAAVLGGIGAVVPGAGKLSKAARESASATRGAEAVSDATKVAQEVAAPSGNSLVKEEFKAATPNISKSEVRNAKTIRDLLAGNGYMDHPDHALYAGALDMPAATGRTWSEIARRTNGSLDEFYKMSELEQDRAFAKAAEKLNPYLRKKDGTNADLLSQNGKLLKAQGAGTKFDGMGVENWGVNLSPALQWDIVNMCGNSASCIRDCLGKVSGGYAQDGALHDAYKWNNARGSGLAKTIALMQEPEAFELVLDGDIKAHRAMARRNGNHLGVRSNVISDVPGILHDRLRAVNPGVSFYDYTKFGAYRPRSANHHYTYSSTGISSPQLLGPDGNPIRKEVLNQHSNWLGKNGMRDTLDRGDNVSVVVSQQNHKPTSFFDEETGRRYQAVEGDSHDFRPLDQTPDGQPGKIIVLGRKGNKHKAHTAHERSNGFIWDYDPAKMGDEIRIPDQRPFVRKRGGKVPPREPLDDELYRNQWANYDHYREGEPIPQEFKNPRLLFGPSRPIGKGKG